MSGLEAGSALDALQSAGAAPKSLRGAITYAAGTTGAIGSTTLFTVTGDVGLVSVMAKCTTDLTSAGLPTWTLGVTGQTDILSVTFPDVTGWDAGEWVDGGSATYLLGGARTGNILIGGGTTDVPLPVSANIIQTIAVATITGGVVRWYLSYIPLSGNGAVTLHANLVEF